MQKMSKDLLALCLVLTMLLFVLAGCDGSGSSTGGDGGEAAPAETGDTQPEAEEAGGGLEHVTLKWYVIGAPQNDPQHVYDEINKITREKINASIEIVTIDWGSYTDKLKMVMSSGEEFDLCFTASWANDYQAAVSKGAFLPLNDLLDEYGQNIMAAIPEEYWDAVRVNGDIYAILNYQIFASYNGVTMNKELVEKYDFDVSTVKKLADIEPFLEAVKENEPEFYPFLAGYMVPYFNWETGYTVDSPFQLEYPFYVYTDDEDVKVFNIYETDIAMEYLGLMRDWYEKGYIRKDMASLADVSSEQASGKYACFISGSLKPGNEIETMVRVGFEVVDVPTAPAYISTGGTIATMTAISRTSQNPERAMMFYDLLYSDKDLYNLVCFGVEGVDYEMVGENTVRQLENSGYAPNTDWVFGNQFNAYLREGQEADTWEQTIKLNEQALPSPLLGFTYDKENLKTENAQIDALVEEYKRAFNSGTLDPEVAVPEFNQRLKDAGIDAVLEDMQAQIDDWLAGKS